MTIEEKGFVSEKCEKRFLYITYLLHLEYSKYPENIVNIDFERNISFKTSLVVHRKLKIKLDKLKYIFIFIIIINLIVHRI